MSNKTSDENVGNKIKQQTENTIKYYKNIDNIEEVPIDILRAMYKDILSDYTRQKQMNEEHQKENGEMRQAINTVEKEKADWIRAYQEEKDSQFELLKRIQELEEENKKCRVGFNQQVEILNNTIKELNNSISKQVIRNKVEKIIRETTPTPIFKPRNEWQVWDYERLYKTQPLFELLEGEK